MPIHVDRASGQSKLSTRIRGFSSGLLRDVGIKPTCVRVLGYLSTSTSATAPSLRVCGFREPRGCRLGRRYRANACAGFGIDAALAVFSPIHVRVSGTARRAFSTVVQPMCVRVSDHVHERRQDRAHACAGFGHEVVDIAARDVSSSCVCGFWVGGVAAPISSYRAHACAGFGRARMSRRIDLTSSPCVCGFRGLGVA